MTVLTVTAAWCPGSGGPEDTQFEGECPVCAKPVYTPPVPTGGYVIERHVPMVIGEGYRKHGVHSPVCRRHPDPEVCICEGAA